MTIAVDPLLLLLLMRIMTTWQLMIFRNLLTTVSGVTYFGCSIVKIYKIFFIGLEICIVRLNLNYKAIYRLAHLYFNYKAKIDLIKCKQLLLSEYSCKNGAIVSGLFSDRKTNNFFNVSCMTWLIDTGFQMLLLQGIWRIPSTEIDRPGSLSAHMNRCITLLLQILRTTNDTKTLIDLYLNLRKAPEQDKYVFYYVINKNSSLIC